MLKRANSFLNKETGLENKEPFTSESSNVAAADLVKDRKYV